MTKTIAIVCKAHHPRSEEVLLKTVGILRKENINIIVEKQTFSHLPKEHSQNIRVESKEDLTKFADLVVVFGGDGTLISVCRHIRNTEKPAAKILGVNLGNLGFLTEIQPEQIEYALNEYLHGETNFASAPLLEIDVENETSINKTPQKYFAINDVVINKQALARIFMLGFSVDNVFASQIRGDGVIISTPNGSTAYSLAAGGSIVHPSVDALLVTPICPHSLSSRPIVIPGNATLGLELGEHGRAEEVYLTVDGQEGMALHKGAKISVKKSTNSVHFLKFKKSNYFENLSNKLKWG